MREATTEQVLKDLRTHKLFIKQDDGVYRHLLCKRTGPDTMVYHFHITTWPGYLCISGDMGCYVFSRIDDMFCFFRAGESEEGLPINPGYWGEKVQAADNTGGKCGIKEFSSERFEENIREYYEMWFEDGEPPEELWGRIQDEVLRYADDGMYPAYDAANNFEYEGFRFQDFWESNNEVYTYHYIWCCRAIVWAIQQYDKEKDSARKDIA